MAKIFAAASLLFGAFILGIAAIVGLSALFALPVLWLANYVFTPAVLYTLFGVGHLGFLKAWGLNVLCGFIFKSTSVVKTKEK